MRKLGLLLATLLPLLPTLLTPAGAQQVNMYWASGTGLTTWNPVSSGNPLPVTGSLTLAGTTSNASSGVATSSTNLPTVSYNYGFNGTTWDQLQVDGSKFLKVVTQTGSTTAVTQTTSPWIVAGGGTAGTAATGVVTVQGIASMTPLLATGTGTAGTAATGVVTIQGIASMTPLLVTPLANSAVNVAQVGGTNTVSGGVAGSLGVGGTVATNVAITANPLNLGAQAVSSENTVVTTARQVQLVADLVGKLIVLPYSNPENFVSGVITSAMTGTTSTSLVTAPAGSLRNYITSCTFSNAHATVGTDMILQDGSGGTTIWNIPAAAVYGGAQVQWPTPLRQPTAATALFVANVTTGASTKAACAGYKGV